MRFVNVEATKVNRLDEHRVVVRKGSNVVAEDQHESDGFLGVKRGIWVDDPPSIRRFSSVNGDRISRYFGQSGFWSKREYSVTDVGRCIVVTVCEVVESAVFPGIQKWPVAGDGWACHVQWAEGRMKEVFVAYEV
jgi:hypothetical protein